jgi:hypothetical protein
MIGQSIEKDALTPEMTRRGDSDEGIWLRYCVVRLRTILRFVTEPGAAAGLKELIIDAENRLEELRRSGWAI